MLRKELEYFMNRRWSPFLCCLFFTTILADTRLALSSLPIKKVVLWGYKLHSHTHSYIHAGFYRAFKHLGYDTYWFDNKDDVSTFDFSNTLFITEGQVDQGIPIRTNCFYVLHNCRREKYQHLCDARRAITLQVYTHGILKRKLVKLDDCIYYSLNDPDFGNIIYFPWATDLLPHEIDEIKKKGMPKKEPIVHWVGSILYDTLFNTIDELQPFITACTEQSIQFRQTVLQASMQDNINLIQQSYMAPAIVGRWQRDEGYIPCRIFKNISYGQLGVTNSKTVYELFQKKIVYNENTYQLFYNAQERLKAVTQVEIFELMDFVKEKHTYVQRINTLLSFFSLVFSAPKTKHP